MRRIARAFCFALCAILLSPTPTVHAEGLFDFLFGDSDQERSPAPGYDPAQRQSPRRRKSPRRDEPNPRRQRDSENGPNRERRAGGADAETFGGGYCVRICDGYFFPLIKSSRATGQQSCEFSCPSAPVELYRGPSIEQARNAQGALYASLPTAFSFRDKAVEKCACADPQSSASFYEKTARSDPTLRSGDIVIENSGPFVYNGASLVTFGQAPFVPAQIRLRLKAMLQQNSAGQAPEMALKRPPTTAKEDHEPTQAHGSIEFGAPSARP